MKNIFVLWCLTLISFSYGATIKGHVFGEKLAPVSNAELRIDSEETIVFTDKKGYFTFNNIPVGKYVIEVSSLGYYNIEDTVIVKKSRSIVNLRIILKEDIFQIDTVTEIENYHRYFKIFNSDKILKIRLDSLDIDINNTLNVYSTFYNQTDTAIYVIADFEYLGMIKPIVTNSHSVSVDRNILQFDCMRGNLPYPTEFIKIAAHSSVKYPPVYLYLYGFDRYPPDTYSIKLRYINCRSKRLFVYLQTPNSDYSKPKYYLNMALRGDFISENSLSYNNSKISKVKDRTGEKLQFIPLQKENITPKLIRLQK